MSLDLDVPAPPTEPTGESGEVFTRRWVVELILDLAGYTPDRDLATLTAWEPSCGAGAFLGPMVERLALSCRNHRRDLDETETSLRAFDLQADNVEAARLVVTTLLATNGFAVKKAKLMATKWVTTGDFLLQDHAESSADFVLGNPPYIRLENLVAPRNALYRSRFPTMRGRSDIFVGFIEAGLRLLKPEGALGFIVADRWMRNRYGALLRDFVARRFSVDAVIEMHDVDAFEDDVSAYPAITVIRHKAQTKSVVASATGAFGASDARRLGQWVTKRSSDRLELASVRAARLPGWFRGDEPWPSGRPEQLAVIADLERRCPPLEDPRTGTRIGIGLATGADDVYLTRDHTLAEPERLLPVVMTHDIVSGRVSWSGTYLLNPWDDQGLIDIEEWPRLREYLEFNGDRVKSRHTAMASPERWYRTIDRMIPGLQARAKLLLPELRASAHPVLEEGGLYPHHNLCYVTTTAWDLEVLGGLMLSDIANLIVGAYCVKMRGGTYRFQAQYLRRIRVPDVASIPPPLQRGLAKAFSLRDVEAATAIAAKLYEVDRSTIGRLARPRVA